MPEEKKPQKKGLTIEQQRRWFNVIYSVVVPIIRLFYPIRSIGRENIPDGPAVFCANHSHLLDPILAAGACGRRNYMHFIAKLELKRAPVIGKLIELWGVCFVNRGTGDIDAMRSMMRLLKHGEKIFIFPEGTRTSEDNAVDAKTGAVRLASKLKVPIVPMYIPRHKKLFRRMDIIIGKPYSVEGRNHEEYEELSEGIMDRIYELRDGVGA